MEEKTEQEVMMETMIKSIQGLLKSKTAYGNVVGIPTILLALNQLGTTFPILAGIATNPIGVAAVYVVGNLFFRWITKTPLSQK